MKLSKDQQKERTELLNAVSKNAEELNTQVEDFNLEISRLHGPVEAAVEKFNEAKEALKIFIESVRDEAQEEFDDKSEKWQEGDKGQELYAYIGQLDEDLCVLEDASTEHLHEPNALETTIDPVTDIVLPTEPGLD